MARAKGVGVRPEVSKEEQPKRRLGRGIGLSLEQLSASILQTSRRPRAKLAAAGRKRNVEPAIHLAADTVEEPDSVRAGFFLEFLEQVPEVQPPPGSDTDEALEEPSREIQRSSPQAPQDGCEDSESSSPIVLRRSQRLRQRTGVQDHASATQAPDDADVVAVDASAVLQARVRDMFSRALSSGQATPSVDVAVLAEQLAGGLAADSKTERDFKTRARSLSSNLRKNEDLRCGLLDGTKMVNEVVKLHVWDLARRELREERQKERDRYFKEEIVCRNDPGIGWKAPASSMEEQDSAMAEERPVEVKRPRSSAKRSIAGPARPTSTTKRGIELN